MLGKLVSTYVYGFIKAGSYNAQHDGSGLSSGVFSILILKDFNETKKMNLIK